MWATDAIRCSLKTTPVPGDGHIFWRVNILKTSETGAVKAGISWIEFRNIVGGPPLSSGGVAIASSYYSSSEPIAAFTDNTAQWLSGYGAELPQWIGYQHLTPVSVAEVVVGNGSALSRAPIDFTVDHSDDGSTWITALTITNEPPWGSRERRVFQL